MHSFYKSHKHCYLEAERIAMECGSLAHISTQDFERTMASNDYDVRSSSKGFMRCAIYQTVNTADILSELIWDNGFACMSCNKVEKNIDIHESFTEYNDRPNLLYPKTRWGYLDKELYGKWRINSSFYWFIRSDDDMFSKSRVIINARADRYDVPYFCNDCFGFFQYAYSKMDDAERKIGLAALLARVLKMSRFREHVKTVSKPKFRFNPAGAAPIFEPDSVKLGLIRNGISTVTTNFTEEMIEAKNKRAIEDAMHIINSNLYTIEAAKKENDELIKKYNITF